MICMENCIHFYEKCHINQLTGAVRYNYHDKNVSTLNLKVESHVLHPPLNPITLKLGRVPGTGHTPAALQ